ncbi:hypothetical protein TMatcc_004411 [Talaromyces marneffei ATCC 18224]
MPNAWLLDEIYGVGVSSYGSGVGWADLSLITSQIMWYIHRLKCARYLRNSFKFAPTVSIALTGESALTLLAVHLFSADRQTNSIISYIVYK